MAITDNSITADELQAAAAANPAILAELKTFAQKSEGVYRTKDEEHTFLTGFEKQKLDARTFEIATGIEKDVFNTTGVAKNENEKYHDYLKRVLGDNKSNLEKMQQDLAILKADPGTDKQTITQLQAAITAEKTQAQTSLGAKDKQIFELKAGFQIEKGLNTLRAKYVAGVPEFAIKATEDAAIAKLMGSLKEIEGNIVVINADGSPKLNPTNYQPVTIEEELTGIMGQMIDKDRKVEGLGTNQQQQQQQHVGEGVVKDAAGIITAVLSAPAEVKSWQDLHAYLLKLGLTTDSEVFNTAYEKLKVGKPMR